MQPQLKTLEKGESFEEAYFAFFKIPPNLEFPAIIYENTKTYFFGTAKVALLNIIDDHLLIIHNIHVYLCNFHHI